MLSLALVEEISRLLAEGQLSHRKIAAKLGVSRGTVGAIASGRRGMYGHEPGAENLSLNQQSALAERCPTCGAMVYKPCLLCRSREYKQRQERLSKLAGGPDDDRLRVA